MHNFRRILVAVDGSEYSLEASSAGGRVAESSGSRIDIVRVIPAGVGTEERNGAARTLNKARELASSEKVGARAAVVEGGRSVVDALLQYASEKSSDLIVVGAKGSGGFERLLMGSVSSGLVTHARIPVLVVRNLASLEGPPFREVLAAVDGSRASREAVEVAASLAKTAGAKLTNLHVISIPEAAYSSGSSVTGTEKKARKNAESYLSAARGFAEECGVDSRQRIVEDLQSPVKGITEYAAKNHIDLIVLGTRGLGGFRRLLLGSVASGVVSYAPCSVLVVRDGRQK